MNNQFHRNLNRMAFFTAFVIAGVILYHAEFMRIAATNIWLNGAIIGVSLFGIGLCFVDILKLLPEYRWLKKYFYKNEKSSLPPKLLRPVAMILQKQTSKSARISPNTLRNFMDMILIRFEDQRESVRYITNTLIFLGLLGTFWGLIHTVGGFSELINSLNFEDESIMMALQSGLGKPMLGMSIAFTCSLFGLAGSLVVGFLGLQVQLAQNSIYRELEENLSSRAHLFEETGALSEDSLGELTKAMISLEKTVSKLA